MGRFLARLISDRRGGTAIEYGLIGALICIAAISAMTGLENSIDNTFNTTSSAMSSANAAG